MREDVIIVGGGPAGLTAALYTARSGWNTLVLDPQGGGGQASTTDMIYNYPGFPGGIAGSQLMDLFAEQARGFGARIEFEEVKEIISEDGFFTVKGETKSYESKAVIYAAGTRPKRLEVPGEEKFIGRGISFCATCDGALFKDKVVAVVGGGDSALTEAEFLTKFCKKVILIHRRDEFRASMAQVRKVQENPKVELVLSSRVEEIKGDSVIDTIRVRNLKKDVVTDYRIDGLFLYVGSIPNTDPIKGLCDLDAHGYALAKEDMSTKTPGLFVAGDVRQKSLRQVATAVGDGAQAASTCEHYLLETQK